MIGFFLRLLLVALIMLLISGFVNAPWANYPDDDEPRLTDPPDDDDSGKGSATDGI